jgi:hypothetical protein
MMYCMKSVITLLVISFCLLNGCAKKKDTLSVDDEKLVPVYAGLVLMSEEFKASAPRPDTGAYQRRVDSLLTGNGMTRGEFAEKLQILAESPLVYQQFSERVRKDLEHRKPR